MSKTFQNKLTQSLIIVTKRRKMSKWFICLGIKFASLISPNLTIFITLWITMKLKGIIQRRKKTTTFSLSGSGRRFSQIIYYETDSLTLRACKRLSFVHTEESYWKKARAHFKYIKKKSVKKFHSVLIFLFLKVWEK